MYNQRLSCHLLARYGEALHKFRLALDLHEQLDNEASIADTLRATGFVYDDLGDYTETLDLNLRALRIDEATGNDRSWANTLRTIGIIYSKSSDEEQGLPYYRQSLELSRAQGDHTSSAKTLNNIGINLKNLGRYEESLVALEEARRLFERTVHGMTPGSVLNNMGLTLERVGRYGEAESVLREAVSKGQQSGCAMVEVSALMSLGELLLHRDRWTEASQLLHAALAVAQRMVSKPKLNACHRSLAELYKKLGDNRAALEHFEVFHALERALFNEQSDRKLKGLQISFQVNQTRRETEMHRLKQVELARAYEEPRDLNQSLREADKQKTQLLAQLEKQNKEDGLTGLFNRRYLDRRLAEEFRRAQRHHRSLAVALADLDYFKRINDRLSHAVGDEVLRTVARIFRLNVRETDVVARYGGEEFALMFSKWTWSVRRAPATRFAKRWRITIGGGFIRSSPSPSASAFRMTPVWSRTNTCWAWPIPNSTRQNTTGRIKSVIEFLRLETHAFRKVLEKGGVGCETLYSRVSASLHPARRSGE